MGSKIAIAIHDHNERLKSLGPIPFRGKDDFKRLNEKGYGIFITVNEFDGPRRKECCTKINAVYCELDGGGKLEQLRAIDNSPLPPTQMVESKNGFHCYWAISCDLIGKYGNKSGTDLYESFLKNNLIPYFSADPNASDTARVLRIPEFFHTKDPSDPFKINLFMSNDFVYTWEQLIDAFPISEIKAEQKEYKPMASSDESLWSKASSLNCEYALSVLSGTSAVSGEVFECRDNRAGRKNIYVNGKSTSCWIDENGKIGSSDGGGPTICNWLYWYHKNWSKVADILKAHFSELRASDIIFDTIMGIKV